MPLTPTGSPHLSAAPSLSCCLDRTPEQALSRPSSTQSPQADEPQELAPPPCPQAILAAASGVPQAMAIPANYRCCRLSPTSAKAALGQPACRARRSSSECRCDLCTVQAVLHPRPRSPPQPAQACVDPALSD
ncbi:uncharacterized protein LOC123401834 [Hordeum vulgare subsp. vulgare]|uniref:uncharacterized protein LOC123401834 n=1 Tax=Hordeum vulgare subsp. vulgare TaxID=112509 RepID=UPI001D1A36D3|nr:uncharacterized protein LOC123401834 [Hordeum vulgare subsp. vulgare]